MKKIAIVTDSTSDIPQELADEMGILIAPLHIQIGDETFTDNLDVTHDEVFEKLISGVYPKTSQPTPADFIKVFEEALQQAEHILVIVISHLLSGAISSAKLAAEQMGLGEDKITFIDSHCLSAGLGLMVMNAASLASAGHSLEEIVKETEALTYRTRMFATFDTFKYTLAGGRFGKAGEVVAGIIPVRPVITLKNGKIALAGFCRTRKKSVEKMYNALKETYEKGNLVGRIGILYGAKDDEAIELKKDFEELTGGEYEVFVTQIGPALGVHGGPETLGISFEDLASEQFDDVGHEKKKSGLHFPKISLPFSKKKEEPQE